VRPRFRGVWCLPQNSFRSRGSAGDLQSASFGLLLETWAGPSSDVFCCAASVIVLELEGACAPAPADQMRAAAAHAPSARSWYISYLKSLGTKSFRVRRHVNHS